MLVTPGGAASLTSSIYVSGVVLSSAISVTRLTSVRQRRSLSRMAIADEVRTLRAALEEDTATFGARWRRSGRTIEGWEQGRREPDAFALDAIRKLAARHTKRKPAKIAK